EEVTEEFGMKKLRIAAQSDEVIMEFCCYLNFDHRRKLASTCRRFRFLAKRRNLRAVDVILKPNFRSFVVDGKVLMKFDSDLYFPLMSAELDGVWISNLQIECKDPYSIASNNFLALFRYVKFTSLSIHFYFNTISAYESIESHKPRDQSSTKVLDVLMRKIKHRDADVTISWDRNVNDYQLEMINEWLLTLPEMRSLTIDWGIFRPEDAINMLTFCDVFH
ncbi:hypothetical protein PFISCL1PPCAC_21139, partial [Pristionchus fissidentatus]